jgi:hypothetical protein
MGDLTQPGSDAEDLYLSRFEPRGHLGEGAFGRVLRMYDRALETEVAFKELTRIGSPALLRFKNEFRALADVSHPNLVRLHELFEDRGTWGFSMELIDGPDFLGYVRGEAQAGFDEVRLRDALRQLTEGLTALHELGLTHRDVKPSNVRVTREGRVVLLDFGLVTQTSEDEGPNAGLGTPAYMAPEQARGTRVDAAADFYALGVMLYEALTDRLPFDGSPLQMLIAKECQPPVSPSRHVPDVPADLEGLCMALLAADPARRATRDEVLLVLGQSVVPAGGVRSSDVFVGRLAELVKAGLSYRRMLEQGVQVLLVEGESGIGKTSLARAFTEQLEKLDRPPLVLSGRCHAAEQLPFKLFDGVVDELSKQLVRMPQAEVIALLPEQASALSTLFPVLAQVTRLRRSSEQGDFMRVERAQSFVRFGELLARLSQQRPLVLRVDDLQWADVDSMALLAALLDSKTPRVLLVVTTRSLGTLEPPLGPLARELLARPEVERLQLEPLPDEHASLLSARCLGIEPDDPRAQRVAREAKGHPLFITELSQRTSMLPEGVPQSLDDALRLRLARLAPTARRVLDLLAVSSAPVPITVLASALKAHGDELARALLELRTTRWARSSRRGDLTCYHDRLREFALGVLSADTVRAHHRLLAQAFRMRVDPDPAEVARHLLGAGEASSAVPWLERAAERALEQQAFERAAELYRSLLAHGEGLLEAPRVHTARIALSDALSSAGRSAEAAAVLVDGIARAAPGERVEREGRAARQLLRAGLPREGLMAARRALEQVGLSWPRSEATALARLLWHRADLAVTGTKPRAPRREHKERRAQLDTLWGLWQPLGWADLLRGAELGARHLRLSLRSGDARHLGLALCAEAMLGAMQDPRSPRPLALLERARAELARCEAADLAAFHAFAAGATALFYSDFAVADQKLREAELCIERDCPGEAWQLVNVRGALLSMWMNRGDFALGAARAEAWLRDARARDDSFAIATYAVTGFGCFRHPMRDDPRAGLAEIEAAMAPWEATRYGLQHFGAAMARHVVLGYESDEGPWEHWQRTWPIVHRSFLMRSQFIRTILSTMCGEGCLRAALAQQGSARKRLLTEARTILAPLERHPGRLEQACFLSIQGQVEAAEGRHELAGRMATAALPYWKEVGNHSPYPCGVLVAWLTKSQREAEETTARTVAWFAQQGWTEPRRALRTWLPTLDLLEERGAKS